MILDEDGLDEHLQVLLTDPDANEEIVTVSVCTLRPRTESLVLVNVGDHPFIRHQSAVPFRHAKIRQCAALTEAVRLGWARPKEPISTDLLQRMRSGLVESDFTPNDVRIYFRSTGTPF